MRVAVTGREGQLARSLQAIAADSDADIVCLGRPELDLAEPATIAAALAAAGADVVINAAAYTHTSVALLDALKAVRLPAAEVHLTDIDAREPFRRISYAGMACGAHFKGLGFEGYRRAIRWLCGL